MDPHCLYFGRNCGGHVGNEEVLHQDLDQRVCGAGVLAIDMEDMEVVAMDILMKGEQSTMNRTVDEENK